VRADFLEAVTTARADLFRIERIVSILAVELRFAAFRGHGLHTRAAAFWIFLFRRLVVGARTTSRYRGAPMYWTFIDMRPTPTSLS